MKRLLVTGSNGLVGSEAVAYFSERGWMVSGIDNNMRREFFGPAGDTTWNRARLTEKYPKFSTFECDIRDRAKVAWICDTFRPHFIIHAAAQPSHDKAASIPFVDFEVNAVGTLNLLDAARKFCPESPFIFMSTNKVYGDAPNERDIKENPTRYELWFSEGIDETCRLDQSTHSLFGASKAAADLLAQEYGRYFGMPVGIFRAGCITGANHSGVQLHGFLNYLVKCAVEDRPYTVFGYKGKQVRDNIHAFDVITAVEQFYESPRPGEVYNIGGGRENSCSILEAIELVERMTGKRMRWRYEDKPRKGDHVCYITNLSKLRSDFPKWTITRSLQEIIMEMVGSHRTTATAYK